MQLRFRSAESASTQLAQIVNADCESAQELMLKRYVNRIGARLTGIPEHLRADICRELRQHLELSIAAREDLKDDRTAATAAAIQQLGNPSEIAFRFRKAWQSTMAYQNPFAAMRIGLIGFSFASAILLLVMVIVASCLQFKSGGFYAGLPVQLGFLLLFWILPILAGIWVAMRSPTRATLGSFLALSALACLFLPLGLFESTYNSVGQGFVIGSRANPGIVAWAIKQVCTLGGFAFALWLPVGCLSAALAGMAKQHSILRGGRNVASY